MELELRVEPELPEGLLRVLGQLLAGDLVASDSWWRAGLDEQLHVSSGGTCPLHWHVRRRGR